MIIKTTPNKILNVAFNKINSTKPSNYLTLLIVFNHNGQIYISKSSKYFNESFIHLNAIFIIILLYILN
nr:MAG TPA_asm: hypothetical protein [Bacteriophage sp.]